MRRLIAFLVDALLAGLIAWLCLSLFEEIADRRVLSLSVILATTGLLLAYFEHQHSGVTPGRLLTGTRLVSVSGKPASLLSLFLRAETLLLFPSLASFISEFIFYWLLGREPITHMGPGDGVGLIFLLSSLTLITSKGSQSFHDFLFRTAVISARKEYTPKPVSNRLFFAFFLISLGTLVVVNISFSSENTQLRNALNDSYAVQAVNSIRQKATNNKLIKNSSVSIHEIDIDPVDLNRYYNHALYTNQISSLDQMLHKLKIASDDLVQPRLKKDELAVEMTALLTFKGITNPAFQEQFAKKVCSVAFSRTEIRTCLLNFVYLSKIIGPTYAGVISQTVVVNVDLAASATFSASATISPPDGRAFLFSVGTPVEIYIRWKELNSPN